MMQELAANGATKAQSYGAWVANRYKSHGNIVWMVNGDYTPSGGSQLTARNALITGLTRVTGQSSIYCSSENGTDSISSDDAAIAALPVLNGAYSFRGDVNTQGRRAYNRSPTTPAFLLEEPYDEEGPDGTNVNGSATQPVRRFQWWGWLSTIGGYMSGNGYVWPFLSPNWQAHLNTQGSRDMGRLNAFVSPSHGISSWRRDWEE